MPTPCYMSITGKVQGLITKGAFTGDSVGNVYVEGHEDEILVQEINHCMRVPTDSKSGQPAGQRRHRPLAATFALNRAVPLLYNALATGECLTDILVKWYRTSTEGKQEYFFSTRLTDAVIVYISCILPHCQDPNFTSYTQLVEAAFAYRKIEWTHNAAGTSGGDDWRRPNEAA